ncbi:MAG: hypothetical protein KGP13_04545 [Burkholderiales bacterium]|nr:hypothetical protein [Burkholderiales bacterium]
MSDEPQSASTDNTTRSVQFGWAWLLGWGVAATVLIGVLSLYLQPTFLVTLASQVWACF